MSFKPSGWMWVLVAAVSLLALSIVLLLRQGAESMAPDSHAAPMSPNMPPPGREPFPEGGELEGVQRPSTLQPRKRLAPDPQFQRPQQK
jgi:hypothetical protein